MLRQLAQLRGEEVEPQPFFIGLKAVGKETKPLVAEHPIVRTHPETGRKALYVNRGFTKRIQGLPRDESWAILNYLWDHAENPLFQCRFRWRENSVAFWDNRCVLHRATPFDATSHKRFMQRTAVQGAGGASGVVVAMDTRTGELLALADRLGRYVVSDVTWGGVPLTAVGLDEVRAALRSGVTSSSGVGDSVATPAALIWLLPVRTAPVGARSA